MADAIEMEFEQALAQKKEELKRKQLRAKSVREAISPDNGLVKIWHFSENKYKEISPIDANEQIQLGLAALQVIDLIGPRGIAEKIDVNKADEYLKKGYYYPGHEPVTETNPKANDKPKKADKPEKPKEFNKPVKPTKSLDILPLPELRRITKKIKIKGYTKLSKPDLVEVIKQAQAKTEK